MSWANRRRGQQPPNPSATPPVQMYNPNQHSTQAQENQWQQNNWYGQQQPQQFQPKQETEPAGNNYWQQPQNNTPQVYNQNAQFGNYDQTGFYPNSGYPPQPAYGNAQYNQQYQNNLYPAQQTQQAAEGDAWNWGWGDEDNSNVQVKQQAAVNTATNNAAGNIGDSFATDESWNWSVDEAKHANKVSNVVQSDNDLFPRVGNLAHKQPKVENNQETAKHQDHLTVTGKRGKLDTPQWSVDSQMSQESSDDILPTSESDKMISRSSTVSHSPISGHDALPNALVHNLEEIPIKAEFGNADVAGNNGQFENKEIVTNVKQEPTEVHLSNRVNPTPPPLKANPTPPPPKNTQTPPLLPPPGLLDDSKNPYKRTAGLSHKAANQTKSTNVPPTDSRSYAYAPPFHHQNVNLETPPDNSEQPDPVPNSLMQNYPKPKPLQQWPENNEAPINDRNQYLETGQLSDASQHDFNQVVKVLKPDVNDALPPPGLRRMVLGQIEQDENIGNASSFGDEPPPGLSRMVLGQTESNLDLPVTTDEDLRLQYEPPEGLRRMIPGESSSPESTLRQQARRQAEDSETEFNQIGTHTAPQQRSATIGADTPPVDAVPSISPITTTNRSETIGGGSSVPQDTGRQRGASASSSESRVGAIGVDNSSRKSKVDKKLEQSDGRRDSIEGQTQDKEVVNIINSVRNLTVGENTEDYISNPGINDNRPSREETSDSEESRKVKRSSRDKGYSEKSKQRDKDRDRDRYTPDNYKDKKYDKRRYKDRKYDDDTEDYLSDKEKDKRRDDRDRDRDYERKYGSLRKDKEKERRRRGEPRDPRDARDSRDNRAYGRDSRRNNYYYSRYENEYDDEIASRPTSRSDSMHESYRGHDRGHERDSRSRRHRDRERERYQRHRDPRDSYNPYQGYAYDPYNPYYQQYQYYENLRRTNPQAYAEWYRKYYQQATGQSSNYGTEDRASVHSGRSSANDELAKDRYTRQSYYSQTSLPHLGGYYGDTHTHSISGHYGLDNSSYSRPFDNTDSSLNFEDHSIAAQRLTPAKFSTAHIKASIASGKLLKILPNYPMDGQTPVVELCNLQMVLENDEDFRELNSFPGPLVKGVTHKKTIIEYCENKIKGAGFNNDIVDVDSYVLMWELLILLIRQNGMVIGTDIAELLLKNKTYEVNNLRPPSVLSSIGSAAGDPNVSETNNHQNSEGMGGSTQSVLKEEEITQKFREYLLYGSCKEALEWAMKHGLWGHALFLASKLDKRTYANVMMRFANGLTINDPLQTLYQLLSGRIPAAVTCVADEKWGDWRPHLAMILSNSTQRPELNCKAITSLGDTLMNRGSLYAAQFCYLMAQVGFGKHDGPDTKLALLGSDHNRTFSQFSTNEAIHMTEIYEYACSLNDPQFIIPEFQIYKYLLATRLADRGLLEKSLSYLEKLSSYIISSPSLIPPCLVDNVCNLADRLKFSDPVGDVDVDELEFGGNLETSRPDHSWLKELRTVQSDIHTGVITQDQFQNYQPYTEPAVEELTLHQSYESNVQESWQQYQQPAQQQWQPEQAKQQDSQQHITQHTENDFNSSQFQEQQQYWQNQPQWGDQQQNVYAQEPVEQQQSQQNSYYGSNNTMEEVATPQISMPNQAKGKSVFDNDSMPNETAKKDSQVKPKPKPPSPEKSTSTGWFGGIFSKLSRPKNQMKLPDDKNPKIVWDEDKKRWVNVDDDGNEAPSELKPPPKMADMMPKMPQPTPASGINPMPTFNPHGAISNFNNQSDVGQVSEQPSSLPPIPGLGNVPTSDPSSMPLGQNNMFKLKRGRNLKKSYVDVFNPNGTKVSGPTSLPNSDALATQQMPQMNFFIPQPVTDSNAPTDFLTPAPPLQFDSQLQ